MNPVGSGMTKITENPVQIGRFDIGDGKFLTLSRPTKIGINCIYLDQPCGALDWCCEGLRCTGFFNGECRNDAFCKLQGQSCDITRPCCQPRKCDGTFSGTCN
ncbi:hypothetical protein QVD17_41887 [Tagetes erecta]|uniref:Uncharacterized protein n=1 Tax=Tagetes erecta TaxID=13708 RepID=A0AAD8JL74_TARER|nr:hypothetical protein QVD17_41887 [Tagetes erecta]